MKYTDEQLDAFDALIAVHVYGWFLDEVAFGFPMWVEDAENPTWTDVYTVENYQPTRNDTLAALLRRKMICDGFRYRSATKLENIWFSFRMSQRRPGLGASERTEALATVLAALRVLNVID